MSTKTATQTQEAQQRPNAEALLQDLSSCTDSWGKLSKGIGVSGVVGVAVGVAVKRLTSDWLYGVGIAVLGLQGLNHLGYIQINWKKAEADIKKVADQNKDNQVDSKDLKILLNRLMKFASNGLSDVGGFAAGFFLGAKYLA